MPSGNSVVVAVSILLCYTCCLAWPTTNYRREYKYFPPMVADYDPAANNWDVAQEPLSYTQPEEYSYDGDQYSDMEALAKLYEMYDDSPPVWGQIVERPETELEELKEEQKRQEKKIETTTTEKPATTVVPLNDNSNRKAVKVEDVVPVPSHPRQGQKEIPLLRPPMTKGRNGAKVQPHKSTEVDTDSEPQAVIAQRRSSPVAEKPSAYDTLRKYLSIEDALQKEAQKRRMGGGNRQKKRSSIVTDAESLAGQLNNLKKSIM